MNMKNYTQIALALALSFSAFAQKHSHQDLSTYAHPIMQKEAVQWNASFTIQNDVLAELRTHIFSRQQEIVGSTLHLDATVMGQTGTYYRFGQFIEGQRVYGAEIVAHVNHQNRVGLITSNTYPVQMAQGDPLVEPGAPLNSSSFLTADVRPVWFYTGNALVPVIRQVNNDGIDFEEYFVNASGDVVWERDLLLYEDTIINVKVFNPDPLTSVQSIYTNPYRDENDQNANDLDPLRVDRTVTAEFNNGTFSLENSYVRIRDFDSPTFAPVTRTDANFFYSRVDNEFEQVNVFYHLSFYQDYMQSLGFNLVNYKIDADANAWSGADQSSFSRGTNPPSLRFGEGGVDDGEDADVIIHEYGHAISASAAPGTNTGTERGCLDEAIGDYLAASYSRNISSYGYDRVFTWDGHNEFWGGRFASNVQNKNYQNLSFFGIYTHTDIWVSALMEGWGKVGPVVMDKVVLEGAYSFSSNMTMPQAAMAIIAADSNLYGGQHVQPIWEAFYNHGILPSNPISVDELDSERVMFYNTAAFSRGQSLQVRLNGENAYRYQLVDMTGRIISSGTIDRGTEVWNYSGSGIRTGAYFLLLTDERGNTHRQKLIRIR